MNLVARVVLLVVDFSSKNKGEIAEELRDSLLSSCSSTWLCRQPCLI